MMKKRSEETGGEGEEWGEQTVFKGGENGAEWGGKMLKKGREQVREPISWW